MFSYNSAPHVTQILRLDIILECTKVRISRFIVLLVTDHSFLCHEIKNKHRLTQSSNDATLFIHIRFPEYKRM